MASFVGNSVDSGISWGERFLFVGQAGVGRYLLLLNFEATGDGYSYAVITR